MLSKRALSLLEIIVSLVILSLTLAGLVNLFISAKRHILHAQSRMAGGEIGKLFLDPLQMQVRQDTWDSPQNKLTPQQYQERRGIYNASFMVSNVSDTPTLRRVVVNLTWNETTP